MTTTSQAPTSLDHCIAEHCNYYVSTVTSWRINKKSEYIDLLEMYAEGVSASKEAPDPNLHTLTVKDSAWMFFFGAVAGGGIALGAILLFRLFAG